MSAPPPPDFIPTHHAEAQGGPKYGSSAAPPCPLPPDLRSDVATSRAEGHAWAVIGAALRYDPDALRRACENDPDYEPAEARAFAAARRSMEADAMRRLRRLMDAESDKVALEAVKVALRFESECRRTEARERAEETRAGTQRLKVYAQKPHLWADAAPRPALLSVERGPSREPWPGRFASPSGAPPSHAVRRPACDDAPPG